MRVQSGQNQIAGRGGSITLPGRHIQEIMPDIEIIAAVAANMREARKAAGLSQEELALEAEVDRTYISQVERGKRNITVVVLARLARALRTTAAQLVSEPAKPGRSAKKR